MINELALQLEARAAARHWRDVNDACPYPFSSMEGRLFKRHFLAARAAMDTTDPADGSTDDPEGVNP